MPHKHVPLSRHKAHGPFFSMFALQKYQARTFDPSGLVSARVAAEMLGVTVSTLYRFTSKKLLNVALDADETGRRYFHLSEVKTLVKERNKLKQQYATTAEVASLCKVCMHSVGRWEEAGLLRSMTGYRADGLTHKLYLRRDIEKVYMEREAFKAKRVSKGKNSRFGRPSRRNWQLVESKVGPRIKQLVKKWSSKSQSEQISGRRLHRQLVNEGYCVGLNTIYVYLREFRQQAEAH